MKKFYTLLAAAAVTLSGMAANFTLVKGDNSTMSAKSDLQLNEKMAATSSSIMKAPKKAPAVNDLLGTYFFNFKYATQGGGSATASIPFTMVAGAGANEVIVKGLGAGFVTDGTVNDLKATYTETFEFQGEVYDLPTLTFAAGQVWFTEDGHDWLFAQGARSAQGGSIDTEGPVYMGYDEESGEWSLNLSIGQGAENGLAFFYMQGGNPYGGIITNTIFLRSNGKFIGTYTEDGQTGEEVEYPIIGKVSSRLGKKTLVVSNIADWGSDVTFTIGADNKLSCDNTFIGTYYTDAAHTQTVDLYFTNNDADDWANPALTATVTETNPTKISLGDLFVVDKTYWYGAYAQSSLEFDSDLGLALSAAINDVAADDTNAPVEYFNLQGMRVNNPANGIFIMRQGTKVAKVIR